MSSHKKDSLTDRLLHARQQLYDIEEIAKDTLSTLQIQHNTLKQTNEELSLSDRFLRRMSQFWRR